MIKKTAFDEFLGARNLSDAELLFKRHLLDAEIIDPSNDRTWAQYANQIYREIGKNDDKYAFWGRLLCFFEHDLEPKWGHLHKGHIFFWLGLTLLLEDMNKAKIWLEKALEEDRILVSKKGTKDIENSSSYVALCLIERIEDSHFDSDAEKQKFFKGLFSPSFNAAIFGQEIDSELIKKSIVHIVPKESLDQALEVKGELDMVSRQRLKTATISLAGSFLESVLLGILYYKHSHKTNSTGKDIRELQLGTLFAEADLLATTGKKVFPSDSIEASCKTIHMFRNRLHPGNELKQKYKLTERVAVTVKNLLDSALLDWSNNLP
jgi:hypothetical protein